MAKQQIPGPPDVIWLGTLFPQCSIFDGLEVRSVRSMYLLMDRMIDSAQPFEIMTFRLDPIAYNRSHHVHPLGSFAYCFRQHKPR
jgi:hypothetical protein